MSVVKLSGMTNILAHQAFHDGIGIFSETSKLYLALFKGFVPTRVELDSFTHFNSFRAGDRLFSTILDQQSTIANGFQLSSSAEVGANNALTPTWYALCGVVTNSGELNGIIVGDVGPINSGASLALEINTLQNRAKYKVASLNLNLPFSFVY